MAAQENKGRIRIISRICTRYQHVGDVESGCSYPLELNILIEQLLLPEGG
jgi:hypothetical protein